MLKRVALVFAIGLLVTVGLLNQQRTQDGSTARFLVLNSVPIAMYNNQLSAIIFIHPRGTTSSIWHDDLFSSPSKLQWSEDGKWLYFAGFPETKLSERDFYASKILRFNTHTEEIEVLATGYSVLYSQKTDEWAYNHYSFYNSNGEDLAPNQPYNHIAAASQSNWLFYITGDPPTINYNIWRVQYDGTERQQLTDTYGTEFLAVSDDGEWVAYIRSASNQVSRHLEIINVDDTTPIPLFEAKLISQIVWSPSAEHLVYAEESTNPARTTIWLVERATLQRELLLTITDHIDDLVWSQDGKWIYYDTNQSKSKIQVYRLNIETHASERLYQQLGERLETSLSWSPPIDKTWHPQWLIISSVLLLAGLGIIQLRRRLPKSPLG